MDFVGYAALGGLERVTIVAGAIIIGYWGYRLYAGEKKAGVIFMGLAVLVLVGALATGTSHLKSVGEGLQLASAPETEAAPPAAAPATVTADSEPATPPAPPQPDAAMIPDAVPEPATPDQPAGSAPETREADATASAPAAAAPTAETAPGSPVRLATGQELGGRIVSVRSENVTLEWSASDSD